MGYAQRYGPGSYGGYRPTLYPPSYYQQQYYQQSAKPAPAAAAPANYRASKGPNMKTLAFIVIFVILIALVSGIIFFKLQQKKESVPYELSKKQAEVVSKDELVFTSPADAEQQGQVRSLAGYDWAVLLNTPLEDLMAMKAVPYLATLDLETAIIQYELLNNSKLYVSNETLKLLSRTEWLGSVMENLAVIEDAYYELGLPSGNVYAERFRHMAERLRVYAPPIGAINDVETQVFVEEHLGLAVDSYDKWYALINIKYNSLVRSMEKSWEAKVEEEARAEQLKRERKVEDFLPK